MLELCPSFTIQTADWYQINIIFSFSSVCEPGGRVLHFLLSTRNTQKKIQRKRNRLQSHPPVQSTHDDVSNRKEKSPVAIAGHMLPDGIGDPRGSSTRIGSTSRSGTGTKNSGIYPPSVFFSLSKNPELNLLLYRSYRICANCWICSSI